MRSEDDDRRLAERAASEYIAQRNQPLELSVGLSQKIFEAIQSDRQMRERKQANAPVLSGREIRKRMKLTHEKPHVRPHKEANQST